MGEKSAGEFESVGRIDGVQQQMRRCAGGPAENPEKHRRTEGGAEQQVSRLTSQSGVAWPLNLEALLRLIFCQLPFSTSE